MTQRNVERQHLLIEQFREDAKEMLDRVELELVRMADPKTVASARVELLKVIHSLHGGARLAGMKSLTTHFENMEHAFEKRAPQEPMDTEVQERWVQLVEAAQKLLDGQPTRPLNSPTEAPIVGGGTLFMVDDESDLLDSFAPLLEEAGYKVHTYTRASQALADIRIKRPDAVITDIQMPGTDGLNFLAQIHQQFPDLPVVIVSGYLDVPKLKSALNQGAFAVLEKPFTPEDAVKTLWPAVEYSRMIQIARRSVSLILYQFSDLEEILTQKGKTELRDALREEIADLYDMRRRIRRLRGPTNAS